MFGLGLQEILLLMMLGGGALVVALIVWQVSRSGTGRVAALEEENRRLRKELDRRDGE